MVNTRFRVIVNADSGQAEHSSVAVSDPEGFPKEGPLDGSHETTDEKTPRHPSSEI